MLDIHLLRNDLEQVAQALLKRGYSLDKKSIEALESRRKQLQVKTQDLQALRNSRSREIGKAKSQGADIQPLLEEVATLGDQLKDSEAMLDQVQDELNALLMEIPNIPHESVPYGQTEEDNAEDRKSVV